jgi:hypothetical protein
MQSFGPANSQHYQVSASDQLTLANNVWDQFISNHFNFEKNDTLNGSRWSGFHCFTVYHESDATYQQ